ncbi:hypothetical protein FI667_g11138, partial [Globisporangium splendens]
MYNDSWHRKQCAQALEDLTSEERWQLVWGTTAAGTPRPKASGTRPPTNGSSDSIEEHLLLTYSTLNDEIIRNEETVEGLLQRVQTVMLTDMSSAVQQIEQIDETKASIQGEFGTLDIPHIQRASHKKCTLLASQVQDKQVRVVGAKTALDVVAASSSGDDGAT